VLPDKMPTRPALRPHFIMELSCGTFRGNCQDSTIVRGKNHFFFVKFTPKGYLYVLDEPCACAWRSWHFIR